MNKINHECGIFGIYTTKLQKISNSIYFGLYALQHRGQEGAGIAVSNGEKIHFYKNNGLVHEVFTKEIMQSFPDAYIGVGHAKYSMGETTHALNTQPITVSGKKGRMSIVLNGNIINIRDIKNMLIKEGMVFQSRMDAEVIIALVNHLSDNGIEDGIINAVKMLKGSFALMIMTTDSLIAVRDAKGMSPLILGKNEEGDYIVSSESVGIDIISGDIIRDIMPGEILVIKDNKLNSQYLPKEERALCIFEYVYLARTDSIIDEKSVYEARLDSGKELAKLFPIEADIVAGVPDSAAIVARGYSEQSGLPLVEALAKNRYVGRTFIQPEQSARENSVRIKLNPVKANVKGKKVILCDDSIVRGTTSKKIVAALRQAGATEVHMMISSPTVNNPCYFGIDIQSKDQLIGAKYSCEDICKFIGADSLHFLPLNNLIKACSVPNKDNCNFCKGCFSGKYPYEMTDEVLNKLEKI